MEFSRAVLLAVPLLGGCAAPGLPRFERTLAAHDSATVALGEWCGARGIADPPTIVAQRLRSDTPPLPADAREVLTANAAEPVAYRHVRLMCGGTVLSEAHNWYIPGRLTAAMNAALDGSDAPFGRVVAPLGFTRRRLAERRGRSPDCPAGTILSHRAALVLPDGRAFSLVVECYTRANLGK